MTTITASEYRKLYSNQSSGEITKDNLAAEMKKANQKRGANNLFSVINSVIQGWEMEYRFDDHKNYRFDFALPSHKIAIEYEGLFSDKSGHTTIKGYIKDTEKYNLGTIKGWKILRYTAKTFKNAAADLEKII